MYKYKTAETYVSDIKTDAYKKEYISQEEFEEQELLKVQEECRQYGYQAFLQFGEIHIRTRFENWYFIPSVTHSGCIKLMHGNGFGKCSSRYHKQFSRKMDYHGLIIYIHEHENAKYCGEPTDFTFTKTGAFKKALA